MCVSKSSKEQICLPCTEVITDKDFRRKLMISGDQKKTKACLNLAYRAWQFKKQFERDCMQHDCLKTARLRTQASLNLELISGKEIFSGEGSLLTNICAEIT